MWLRNFMHSLVKCPSTMYFQTKCPNSKIKHLLRFFCINYSRLSQILGHSYRQKLKFFGTFVFLKQKFPNLLALWWNQKMVLPKKHKPVYIMHYFILIYYMVLLFGVLLLKLNKLNWELSRIRLLKLLLVLSIRNMPLLRMWD